MKEIDMKQSVNVNVEKITERRKLKCWSQARLAQVSGLGERSVQRIESEGRASYQNAHAVAGALGFELEEIIAPASGPASEKSNLFDLVINKKAKFYKHVSSGNELMAQIAGADMFSYDEGTLKTQAEVDLVAPFVQEVQDYGQIISELEPGSRIEAALKMTNQLTDLETAGFLIFTHVERRAIKIAGRTDLNFNHFSMLVLKKGCPEIITNNVGKLLVAVIASKAGQQVQV